MINDKSSAHGGGEINPFTNYVSTKYKLINVWMLIKTLPLLFINGNEDERRKSEQTGCLRQNKKKGKSKKKKKMFACF